MVHREAAVVWAAWQEQVERSFRNAGIDIEALRPGQATGELLVVSPEMFDFYEKVLRTDGPVVRGSCGWK